MAHLTEHDVSLIFDRYYGYSIKRVTRAERTKNVVLKQTLSLKTCFPERKIALGTMHNKVQLIHLIAKYTIFVISADEVPALVSNGIQTKKIDIRTTHEEGDIIVIQQCYGVVNNGCSFLKVISDDTDIFVLATTEP